MSNIRPRPLDIRPEYEWLQRRVAGPLQVLVVLAAIATVPVIIAQERGDVRLWVAIADWAIWWIFVVELAATTLCARDRLRCLLGNWVSVAVIVLSFPALPDLLAFIRLVRVARLLRLFRLARILAVSYKGLHTLRHSVGGQSVLYLGSLTALMTVAGGALLAFLEPDTAPEGFLDGIWWAAVTVTTVGYGDIAPQTFLGRLLAVILMLCGLGLLSTLAAAISAFFIGAESEADAEELRARLERIERKLDRLLAEPSRKSGPDREA